jgi:predicted RNA binding protein YcfA (HicA-like mRNA interferase family)
MPKIPSYKHLDRVLISLGYTLVRIKGSHVQYKKGSSLITVAKHANKEISIGVLGIILKELNLSRDEFWKLYYSL